MLGWTWNVRRLFDYLLSAQCGTQSSELVLMWMFEMPTLFDGRVRCLTVRKVWLSRLCRPSVPAIRKQPLGMLLRLVLYLEMTLGLLPPPSLPKLLHPVVN